MRRGRGESPLSTPRGRLRPKQASARETAARQAEALLRPGRSPERVRAQAKGFSARPTLAIRAPARLDPGAPTPAPGDVVRVTADVRRRSGSASVSARTAALRRLPEASGGHGTSRRPLCARSGRPTKRASARESAARQAEALLRPGRSAERASAEAKGFSARPALAIRARVPGLALFAPAHGRAGAREFVDGQIRGVRAARLRADRIGGCIGAVSRRPLAKVRP